MRTCQAIEYQFLVFGPLGNEGFRTKPLNIRERGRIQDFYISFNAPYIVSFSLKFLFRYHCFNAIPDFVWREP